MTACQYFGKLNSALFLNWACYNIYVNLDGLTTIIVEVEMMVRSTLSCIVGFFLENIIFLLTHLVEWYVK